MAFEVIEMSVELNAQLRGIVEELRVRDPDLARQLRRAAQSVALNLGEGNRRRGRDRLHLWNIAAGSADELRMALRLAIAWGDLTAAQTAPALALADQVLAILWKLTRKRA